MKKEYIFAAISIFCWSTVATVSKLLLNGGISNIQLLWVSSFCGGLFLLAFNCFTGKIKQLRTYSLKDYLKSALIGLPGTFLYYIFYYFGTSKMPASQAFIINYLWPIMSLVFAAVILKEKLTLKSIIAIGISFFGIVVIMIGSGGEQRATFLIGAVSCILAAVSYGAFTALTKKYSYEKSISMMLNYSVTFILTTAINFVGKTLFVPNAVQWLGCMWNGIFTMAIASTLWLYALQCGKTEKISNLAYITPFLSIVWTSVFLKEHITIYSIIGLLFIVLGIVIQLRCNTKDSEEKAG